MALIQLNKVTLLQAKRYCRHSLLENTSQMINIPIAPDDAGSDAAPNPVYEGDETFTFNIDSVSGASRGTPCPLRVTIDDNETPSSSISSAS